ncbi:hypothetical protein TNCV_1326481 [Trichonephila clavipes]|nr:hypothetical protein TNCV_1326481 [Trichonephila clavipes]
MESLEMLRKCMMNLPWRNPRFTNNINVLKMADNTSKAMDTLDDRLQGKQKMLRWCLNMFGKIIVKHLHKSLKIHTFPRRRLRESIHRKQSQFWQSDD